MASLGTLELGTFANVSNTNIVGTQPVLEAIASANDLSYVHDSSNSTHTGVASFALAAVPADFSHVDTVSVQLRYAWESGTQTNSWDTLTAQIVESDGSTALTDEVTVESAITTTTPTDSSVIPMTNPNTSADKTVWDEALVLIRFGITRSKSGDDFQERVFAAEVTGTYTIAEPSTGIGWGYAVGGWW